MITDIFVVENGCGLTLLTVPNSIRATNRLFRTGSLITTLFDSTVRLATDLSIRAWGSKILISSDGIAGTICLISILEVQCLLPPQIISAGMPKG